MGLLSSYISYIYLSCVMLTWVPWTLWQQIEPILFVVALPKEASYVYLMDICVCSSEDKVVKFPNTAWPINKLPKVLRQ
jgi:hypothetical protein